MDLMKYQPNFNLAKNCQICHFRGIILNLFKFYYLKALEKISQARYFSIFAIFFPFVVSSSIALNLNKLLSVKFHHICHFVILPAFMKFVTSVVLSFILCTLNFDICQSSITIFTIGMKTRFPVKSGLRIRDPGL